MKHQVDQKPSLSWGPAGVPGSRSSTRPLACLQLDRPDSRPPCPVVILWKFVNYKAPGPLPRHQAAVPSHNHPPRAGAFTLSARGAVQAADRPPPQPLPCAHRTPRGCTRHPELRVTSPGRCRGHRRRPVPAERPVSAGLVPPLTQLRAIPGGAVVGEASARRAGAPAVSAGSPEPRDIPE